VEVADRMATQIALALRAQGAQSRSQQP
jgi:hypothetical protein